MEEPPIVVERFPAYACNIAGGPGPAPALLGRRVALVIDAAAGVDVEAVPLPHWAAIVNNLERMLELFDAAVGKRPVLENPYKGRARIEVAFLPNAAGLARHGVAGIAVGPAFLHDMIAGVRDGSPVIPHVFWYETMRNYIFPDEFTACFDYRLAAEGPDCWGWVNQGFVNVCGALLSIQLQPRVRFDYHGHTLAGFCDGMLAELQRYIDGPYEWADVFQHERFPWNPNSSLDNAYSGLLVLLFRGYGGQAFLRRWFRVIPLLLQRCPATKDDYVTARDNF